VSLLDQAALDLRSILTDAGPGGFALPITVTDPSGVTAVINGLQNDVHLSVDPQTGVMIAGRRASVALSLAALAAAGLGEPRAIADGAGKPWVVAFTTPTGKALTMKVAEALPDELGCIVCLLETYVP
jgi:hypothetical protein